jgi:hypothetical protein
LYLLKIITKDGEFDIIICFYFVDKDLNKRLLKWLRPGGILIYESFTTNQLKVPGFDRSNYGPQDFLHPQELLFMFPSMSVLKYEEPIHNASEYKAGIILKKATRFPNTDAKKSTKKEDLYSSK